MWSPKDIGTSLIWSIAAAKAKSIACIARSPPSRRELRVQQTTWPLGSGYAAHMPQVDQGSKLAAKPVELLQTESEGGG